MAAAALVVRLAAVWSGGSAAPTPVASASAGASAEALSPAGPAAPSIRPPLSAYALVSERNLFSPTRTEVAAEPPRGPGLSATVPAAAKPRLYGVLLGVDEGVAYLEDPRTRKVFAYRIGDSIADSRLERIQADRVVLRRGGELFEVLLRDPSKPKPPPAPTQAGAARPQTAAPQSPGTVPGAPFAPGSQTTPVPGQPPSTGGAIGPPGSPSSAPTIQAPGRAFPPTPRRAVPQSSRPTLPAPQPAPEENEGE